MLKRGGQVVTITPQIRAFFDEPKTLIVTKANVKSRVHRRVYLDYIGVKRFDDQGKLAGEFRIVGLFTSTAYTRSPRTIPYLRRKVDAVVRRAGFDPDGHSGKALVNVLESYPRDELFQIDEDTLYQFALLILQLDERPRVRVLARRDRFDRFVSILVFVPRERYDTDVREEIGEYLAEAFKGHVSAFYPSFTGRPADAHPLHHRPRRGRDAGSGPRDAGRGGRRDRAHLDRRARRRAGRRARAGDARGRCSSAIARRFRTAIARSIRRSMRSSTSARSKACRRTSRSASISIIASGTRSSASGSRSGATTGRSRCPSACPCWRTWASRWSTSRPSRSPRRRPGCRTSGSTT